MQFPKSISKARVIQIAIVAVSIVTVGLLGFLSWLYLPLLSYEPLYYNLYDQGFVIQTNGEEQPKPEYGYYKDNNVEYKQVLVVLNSKDPFYPIIYHLGESKNEAESWDVDQLTLRRDLFGYSVWQRNKGFVRKMSVAEVTTAAQNYKFNEYSKTKDTNIVVSDQLTREQVQSQKNIDSLNQDYAHLAEITYKIGAKELSLSRKLENIETFRKLYKEIEAKRAIDPNASYRILRFECTQTKIQTQKDLFYLCLSDVSLKSLDEIEIKLKNNELEEGLHPWLAAHIWDENFRKLRYTVNEN